MLEAASALSRSSISSYVADFCYNRIVFLLPPWKDIYHTDSERDQTFEEASAVFEGMKKWYGFWGYQTVEVPCTDVEQRAEYILDTIYQTGNELCD